MEHYPPGYIVMRNWNVVVIEHEGQIIEKFLGYWANKMTYRISSQIEIYDPATDSGRTLSGSRYKFLDKPGVLHPHAQEIYDMLGKANDVVVSLKYPPVVQ